MLQALKNKLPEIEFVIYENGSSIPYVANGTADLDVYSYGMSSERNQLVDFSQVVNMQGIYIFTAKNIEFSGKMVMNAFDGFSYCLILIALLSNFLLKWLHLCINCTVPVASNGITTLWFLLSLNMYINFRL